MVLYLIALAVGIREVTSAIASPKDWTVWVCGGLGAALVVLGLVGLLS